MSINLIQYVFLLVVKKIKQLTTVSSAIITSKITRYPKYIENFEKDFANFVGKERGLSFCNGTSAIEATLFAMGIGPGDEVAVPSCTFHASIDPIINCGAEPLFIDVNLNNLNICPDDLAQKITPKTKAVIVVHLFGIPADMKAIEEVCQKHKAEIIEDVSHAHGAVAAGKACGSWGRASAFSLQGNKAIAAGEGGIALTNNDEDFYKMSFWGHFDRHGEQFDSLGLSEFKGIGLGRKRRMAPLGALLAAADLQQIDQINKMMNKTALLLDQYLSPIESIHTPKLHAGDIRGGFYCGYPFSVKDPQRKNTAMQELKKIGVETSSYPFDLHHQMSIYQPKSRANILRGEDHGSHELNSLPHTEKLRDSLILIRRKHLITLTRSKIKKITATIQDSTH